MPGVPGPRGGTAADPGRRDAVRPTPARHGFVPEDLSGASYERLQKALFDLFGLRISQGGLTNMLRRAEARFEAGRDAALSALRRATVVASDETGVRIEGTNSFHWVFRCEEAVVHHAASTRGACVVHEIMDGHRPVVWLSDRYSAQQGHADRQQTCLAHLARDVAYALDAGDDTLALRLKLWLDGAFALARTITTAAPSTINTKRRKLERSLDDILVAPATCDLARDIQNRMRRARDQLLTFASFPGRVEATNNAVVSQFEFSEAQIFSDAVPIVSQAS